TKISIRTHQPFEQLKAELYYFYKTRMPSSQMSEHTDLAQSLFKALSTFVSKQYGRYILLIDEYDIPFITGYLAKWSNEDKQAALDILKALFQEMFK
ncbi:hypothetical protein EV174_007195, partial [Coemansia sp. RSA 2320]